MAVTSKVFAAALIGISLAVSPLMADETSASNSSAPDIKGSVSGKEVQGRAHTVRDEEKPPVVPMPAFALERYSGEYISDIHGTVKVEKKGDRLELTGPSGKDHIELDHWDGNKFKASLRFLTAKRDAGYVAFSTAPGGVVYGMDVDILGKDGRGTFRKASAESQAFAAKPGRDKVVIEGMKVTRDSSGTSEKTAAGSGRPCEFDKLCDAAVKVNGVLSITYEQFQRLRASADKYVLVDVLSSDDYGTGHIPGAISFPLRNITVYTAVNKIPMGSNVVVYCLDHNCPYSDEAARKLSGFGYRVLAYKGGLDEWQQKGQKLERN